MAARSPVTKLLGDSPTAEGPAFDREGNLSFVNWDAAAIMRLTPAGELSQFFNTGGIPAGLAFHRDGSLWVADEGDDIHGLLRIEPDGSAARIVVNSHQGRPLNGANDLMFDANGVCYFSDPWRSSLENLIGGFYRYFPDGRLEQIDAGLAFPNGLAITADGSAVYLAETQRRRILRYGLNADGTFGPREHWADVSGEPGPDGMALDERGYLYVAHWSGGRVAIYDPTGVQVDEIPIPGRNVTNCAFGGPERRTLVVTEVETSSLYTVEVDAPGQRLYGQ